MKHAALGVALILAMGVTQGASQSVKGGDPSDEATIQQVMADLAAAWNQHDITTYSALFTEDVDFTNWRGTLRVHGRADLRSTHAPLFAGMFRQSKVEVTDCRLRFYTPTVVAAHCVWSMVGTIDYDGKGIMAPRTYLPLFILTQDHRTWLIAVMHNVLIQPLPPGAEERIKGPVKQ